ncbi:MAG: tRNA 2-selenouridine(34) synthase MnmH, partial [Bacteroidota bacterium]
MSYLNIEDFIFNSRSFIIVDVRSPTEYDHAHMPNAINIPLFSDIERSEIGTLYKKNSKKAAIKKGLEYYSVKMRAMIEQLENLYASLFLDVDEDPVFIYCWRGGMRSGAVSWLFDLYGFEVYTLTGGYKAYRNWVIQQFGLSYNLKIIAGNTGVGKTKYLSELCAKGMKVIDLERLASHKGSAFGSINMPPQPTQEMFENMM